MKRDNAAKLDTIIATVLREEGLEKQFLEYKVVEKWPELMGPMIAKYTGNISLKDGVLYVQIRSAALRQELFIGRKLLIEKLNQAIGAEIVNDIRLT